MSTATSTDPREASAHPSIRERILDAAWEVTCGPGWSEVTMAKLAAKAGVSRQTVYNEMGSKPALGQALVLRELDRFLAVVDDELGRHEDVVEAIRATAERLLEMAAENPLLHAVISTAHGGTNDLLPLLTTQSEPVIGAATAVIAERIPAQFPDLGLTAAETTVALDSIVRLVLSHVTQPGKSPADTATDIAWISARVLGRPC
ncbi:MAG TPA: TetR family transcriptional regulator [Nocardioidaceae bacterium]|nr:TetR family transcriptional regulator [Nocardioidaceae bacterium]